MAELSNTNRLLQSIEYGVGQTVAAGDLGMLSGIA